MWYDRAQMVLLPQVDHGSGEPLYRQLYEHFRDAIASGKIVAGERLPATRELAGTIGLNRNTISAAYAQLEAEGFIVTHTGRGTFVTPRAAAPHQKLDWNAFLGQHTERRPSAVPVRISFAHSRPAEELFPLQAFAESCEEVLRGEDVSAILQLGSPGGYEPLRQLLLEQTRLEGAAGASDGVMISSGCQQALDLVRRVLVRPGDRVILEDPIYPGVRNLLAESKAELVGVPFNQDGLDLHAFERALLRGARLVVLTPNFQNPTGLTMSLEARQHVIRLAREAGAVLVENDSYGRLRYQGEGVPTLKQLDPFGDVILLRSFSKMSFPGLRVGWISAPLPLIEALIDAKQRTDLHSDQFSQAVMLAFVEAGRMLEHQRTVIEAGRRRLAAALAACREHLPEECEFTEPEGGMNLWITLPEPLDAGELLPRAQREGVGYLPGSFFGVTADHRRSLRLSFAAVDTADITRGVALLGKVFRGELAERRWGQREPSPALV